VTCWTLPSSKHPDRNLWRPGCPGPTSEAVFVEVEVPGLGADDVEAHVEGNVLTITGSRTPTRDAGRYLERQRPAGAFSRAFTLTQAPRDVQARLEDGLLTVTLTR